MASVGLGGDASTGAAKETAGCIESGCAEDAPAESTAHAAAGSEPAELNLSKVLTKFRKEAMFELRKLRLQQRPVTDFHSKERLERLLAQQRAPPPSGSSAPPPPPADEGEPASVVARARELDSLIARDAARRSRMPESIQLEVRGLFEQRPVSNLLQGPVHERIEQALRDGLERRARRQPARRRVAQNPANGDGGADHGRSRLLAAIRSRQPRRSQRVQASPALQRRARRAAPPHYPRPSRDQSRIVDHIQQSPALNSLEPDARNRIMTEVSHLVQQQLVSSALTGEFRGVLELHIQERADRMGRGESVGDHIRSQRRENRSDDLASERPSDEDEDEALASDRSVSHVRREISELKAQMKEMKQMLRISFDLQLDIQRSIRQEVAAALATCLAPPPLSVPPSGAGVASAGGPPPRDQAPSSAVGQGSGGVEPQVVDSGNCAICSEAGIDCVLYRCGHMCVCVACGLELRAQGLKCPVCRAPIVDIVRAFASML